MDAYTLIQIPHPMHNVSDMNANFDVGITSMQSFPAKENIYKKSLKETNHSKTKLNSADKLLNSE